jgi:hypothetical protein
LQPAAKELLALPKATRLALVVAELRMAKEGQAMPGKRVQIDNESWAALDLLARDRMMTFQELADEAFADLLKKHGRPVDLRTALRKSAGVSADVIPLKRGNKKPAGRGRGK